MSSNSHMCTASTLSQQFSPTVYTSKDENTKSRKDGKVPLVLYYTFGGPCGLLFFLKITKEHLWNLVSLLIPKGFPAVLVRLLGSLCPFRYLRTNKGVNHLCVLSTGHCCSATEEICLISALRAHCWFFFPKGEDAQVSTAEITRQLISVFQARLKTQWLFCRY